MRAGDMAALFQESFSEWMKHNVPRLSASLAFYTLLSLAPLLLIVVAVAGLAIGGQIAQKHLVVQIGSLVGPQGAYAIKAILEHMQKPETGIFSILIGTITLLAGASGVFGELQSSLNIIWEVEPKPDQSWREIIGERFFSFLMVLGSAFLLLVSLILTAVLAALGKYATHLLPLPQPILESLNFIVSLGVIAGIFALLFKYVPDAAVTWNDVQWGALVSALLFVTGKFLIGLYLGRSAVASAYGAAGSLVIILVWVYYSAQVVFLGAEFTRAYANRYGSGIAATGPKIRRKAERPPVRRAA